MHINICIKDTVEPDTDLFAEALDAYTAWLKSGRDHKTAQHLFDAWDEAIMKYAEFANVSRVVAVDMIYRSVEVALRDSRIA